MDWNKDHIRETMLFAGDSSVAQRSRKLPDYVSTARLDRSEPIENDEQFRPRSRATSLKALDDTLHDYANKLEKLRTIDFGPQVGRQRRRCRQAVRPPSLW